MMKFRVRLFPLADFFKLDYVDQFWTVQKHVLFCRYGFSSLDLLENRLDHLDLVDFQYRELSLRSVVVECLPYFLWVSHSLLH